MIRCKVVESGSKFNFTCESSVLASIIAKVVNVTLFANCSDGERHHIIAAYKGCVFIIGHTPETFVALEVDGVEVDGSGSFEFSPSTVSGLIKNRKELNFNYDGSRLNLSAVKGRYKADITTDAVTSDQLPYINGMLKPLKDSSDGSIGGDTVDKIRTGIKYTTLTNFYDTNDQPLCFIGISKGTLNIASYDNYHMAQYTASVDKGVEFKLPLSAAAFQLIDKFISEENQEAKFFVQSKFFKVQGERFVISLPPVQAEDEQFSMVGTYLKTLKKPIGELKFNTAGTKTVDNMFTLARDDTKLTVGIHAKGKVDIILNTENGNVSDAFKSDHIKLLGTKKLDFKLDPRVFADLFRKVKVDNDLPMRLYGKKNKGVSSCYVITNRPDTDSKLVLVGTYYE